jgi:hypothetical protein
MLWMDYPEDQFSVKIFCCAYADDMPVFALSKTDLIITLELLANNFGFAGLDSNPSKSTVNVLVADEHPYFEALDQDWQDRCPSSLT